MTDAQFVILVTSVTTLVSTILGFGYNLYRDNRNRKWDLENRRLARDEVMRKIDQNTEISVQAFKEANDVNAKIAALTRQFYESTHGEGAPKVLLRIDENTQEAVQILREEEEHRNEGSVNKQS